MKIAEGQADFAMDVPQIRETYNQIAHRYDLLDWPIEVLIMRGLRRDLLYRAKGRVLEIGIGTGANLRYYPNGVEIIGIDVSDGMLRLARKKGSKAAHSPVLFQMDAQSLAFQDAVFDTVVCTLTLCTVPEPVRGLMEMARVLTPGGRILLLEHIRSSNRLLAWIQKRASPGQERRFGCSLIRRTPEAVVQAGLSPEKRRLSWLGTIASMVVKRG